MMITAVWLRLELRRRWRPLLVLALLVALSTGTVLASVAGARRGASALDRLLTTTLPATAVVQPNEAGFDWDAVRALPGVAAVAPFTSGNYWIEGRPAEDFATSASAYGAAATDTVDRPVVLAGRLADPRRADEAVITAGLAAARSLAIGDVVSLRLFSTAQIDLGFSGAPGSAGVSAPDGPTIPVRIVGVVRSLVFSERPSEVGTFVPSAGLLARYRANLIGTHDTEFLNALVRLDGGSVALPAFRRELAALTGRTDIGEIDIGEAATKIRRTTAFESLSLLAFALAALAAAVVLVGQAVARYTASAVTDLRVLRAIGMPPRQAVLAAAAGPAVAGLVGGAAGIVTAVAASVWLPFGNAVPLEPAPGLDVDLLVLVPGGLLALLLVGGSAAASAALTLAARSGTTPRRSFVAGALARAGLGVTAVVGARFALEPGRGHSALPVRPALLGAVTGVLGVVAAFTFSAGVADAADHPARFGQTAQLDAFLGVEGQDFRPPGPLLAAVTADPDVTAALDAPSGVLQSGSTTFTAYSYGSTGAQPFPTIMLRGAMPVHADQVVLGPAIAAELHADVGDTVALTGTAGTGSATISGVGFVPTGPHNDYDNAAWLTPAGYAALVQGFTFHLAWFVVRPGVDPAVVAARIAGSGGAVDGQFLTIVQEPIEVTQIRTVRVLPLVLGGFLALLAVGAVGHALTTAVRLRRHDVAVLRVLGMTRRQARGVVVTQAGVLAAVGLLFGVPLGLALGRVLWRFVADITPLQYQPPIAAAALLLVAPVTLLAAGALAARPGHRAARLHIAHVLRAE